MPVETRIETLNPRFQPIAVAIVKVCNDFVLPVRFPDFRMKVTETFRDAGRQIDLQAAGASLVKVGWHNFGLAFDFGVFDEHGGYIKDGGHPAYLACGQIGEAFSCVWGGRWTNIKDGGHIEWHPNFTLQQYQAALDAGHNLWNA